MKFDDLTRRIDRLLDIFEISAKALAEKEVDFNKPADNKEIIEKLNNLLDQNKTIARGVALVHEKQTYTQPQQSQQGYQESLLPRRITQQYKALPKY